jgi:hypothetical protein
MLVYRGRLSEILLSSVISLDAPRKIKKLKMVNRESSSSADIIPLGTFVLLLT